MGARKPVKRPPQGWSRYPVEGDRLRGAPVTLRAEQERGHVAGLICGDVRDIEGQPEATAHGLRPEFGGEEHEKKSESDRDEQLHQANIRRLSHSDVVEVPCIL